MTDNKTRIQRIRPILSSQSSLSLPYTAWQSISSACCLSAGFIFSNIFPMTTSTKCLNMGASALDKTPRRPEWVNELVLEGHTSRRWHWHSTRFSRWIITKLDQHYIHLALWYLANASLSWILVFDEDVTCKNPHAFTFVCMGQSMFTVAENAPQNNAVKLMESDNVTWSNASFCQACISFPFLVQW